MSIPPTPTLLPVTGSYDRSPLIPARLLFVPPRAMDAPWPGAVIIIMSIWPSSRWFDSAAAEDEDTSGRVGSSQPTWRAGEMITHLDGPSTSFIIVHVYQSARSDHPLLVDQLCLVWLEMQNRAEDWNQLRPVSRFTTSHLYILIPILINKYK